MKKARPTPTTAQVGTPLDAQSTTKSSPHSEGCFFVAIEFDHSVWIFFILEK